ncbi:MAG: Opacity protein and related surface antigen [Gammaproteobacteria bacterium]|jgi:opacity protein-like surface antigen|nr:Opacity protein and related surface antigen [Gammaproteobacteria bacterium]
MSTKIRFCILYLLALPLLARGNTPYIGLGFGYDSTDFYKRLYITNSSQTEIYDKKDDLAATGVFGNLLAGYQWDFNNFLLATELTGNLSTLKYHAYYSDNEANETSKGNFTISKSYGISVLPGYFILPKVALYAHLGLVRGDFKYSEYKDNSLGNNIGLTEQQWLNGAKYGIGVLMPVQQKLNLRLQYNHIQYQTFTNKNFPVPAGQSRTIKLTPYSNQVELNLTYAFS